MLVVWCVFIMNASWSNEIHQIQARLLSLLQRGVSLVDRAPKPHMAPDGPMKTSTNIDMAALLKATVECDGSTTSLHEVLAAGTGDRTLMLFVRNGA